MSSPPGRVEKRGKQDGEGYGVDNDDVDRDDDDDKKCLQKQLDPRRHLGLDPLSDSVVLHLDRSLYTIRYAISLVRSSEQLIGSCD